MCHSVHRGGDLHLGVGGLHPGGGGSASGWGVSASRRGQHPGRDQIPSLPLDTTGYGQRASGMHPTGMHSCCF